ncbi:hypothetical protein F183_A18870 [Bryobacterales bacterium F-183]|nr:hypothetical protein F183_A18870 [Bryobacterales bacterium F-183]
MTKRATWRLRAIAATLFALTAIFTQNLPVAIDEKARGTWYKGNLHTHTLNSDGDSTPQDVATWYREHGYQFLVLTDHNTFTDPAGLNSVLASKERFLLIPGEELTDTYLQKQIHINAFNLNKEILPRHGGSVAETIQNNVNVIREAKAIPSVNHPNFHWSITAEDLLQVKGLGMFEVYNGHPQVNNVGGGGGRSMDELWDVLLSAGQKTYGIAVDDAHVFKKIGQEFSNPGRGWVCVRAQSLSRENITAALEQGQFYASNGVTLRDVNITNSEYRLQIEGQRHERFTTHFIGAGGKVLASTFDSTPVYRFTGSEKYVRARVDSSFGHSAWTQPVFR